MLDHIPVFDPSATQLTLLAAMLGAGAIGSLTHCVGMCGPFVLGQVGARMSAALPGDFGFGSRLRNAVLAPYHLGRLTTYSAFGTVAGAFGGVGAAVTGHSWLPSLFLFGAAALFFAHAAGMKIHAPVLAAALTRLPMWLRTYLNPPTRTAWGRWLGEYVTGVSLGFLPCGLVYGALAVSAGCGAPAMGAAAMAAFALGTAPALVAVGYGGALLGARRRAFLQSISKPVLMVNALTLFVIAVFSAFGQIR